jgi:predicted glycosyltransferase
VTLGHLGCLTDDAPQMRRIAFYSYDEHGLGHVRRSIAIAHSLSAAGPASILLIAGAREAALFRLPEGTDTLALPAPSTDFNGDRRGPSIGLDMAGTVRMRARTLRNALAAYRPDVLIVDRMALGVHDELAASLGVLREMGTRLVLGLREVIDDPVAVRAEWDRTGTLDVLRRGYDAIWVYGDPRVFDPAVEYDMPADVREMVRYTGYLDRRTAEPAPGDLAARRRDLRLPDGRLALCVLGGGEDGHRLAEAFARATLPAGTTGAVVAGPFMDDDERAALHALASGRHDLMVLDFVADADALIALADDVVAMGGYNTVCEALSSGTRTLIVPRARPSREQVIRAERLSALGAVDMLAPERLSAAALSTWLAAGDGARRARPRPAPIDMGGLRRVPALLDDLLAAPPRPFANHGAATPSRRFTHTSPAPATTTGSVPA